MSFAPDANRQHRKGVTLLRVLYLCCAFLVLIFIGATRAGDNLEDRQQTIERKKREINKILNSKNLERKNISNEMRRVDMEISDVERRIDSAERELKKNRAEFNYVSRRLVETTEQYEQDMNQYRDRLVAYYKNGSVSYLEVLLNSTSFSEFISRMHYLRMIAKSDQFSLGRLQDLCREIETKKVEVEETGQRIQDLGAQLIGTKKMKEGIKSQKRRVLAQVQNNISLYEKQLRELEEENRRIEEEIRRRQKGKPETRFTGTFGNPLCGRSMVVTSPFGYRARPGRRASTNHHGADLRASDGSSICAVADGVVFSAGYRNGYGYTVMIEHSSDLITLYGHGLSNIPVREGQKVKRGDVILRADNSGSSYGSHLHFEVRKNGTAIDPLQYYRGQYIMK